MKIQDITDELNGFIAAYEREINRDPLKNALKGVPGKAKVEVRQELIEACRDVVRRLNGMYGKEAGGDYEWPRNLMFAMGFDPVEMMQYPTDGVEWAVSTLTEREQKVIRLRYEDGMTMRETGKCFNVTQERIRQIEAKALRKLRHPARADVIREGLAMAEARKEAQGRLEAAVKGLNDEIARVRRDQELIHEIIESGKPRAEAEAVIREHFSDWNTGIEEMDLSVRAYNCLKRAGYNKIIDLVGVTREKLMKVRNLGRKSTEEVIEKLGKYGIEVTDGFTDEP